jgi:hypothetical protein
VEESCNYGVNFPDERNRMIRGVLDLLLYNITTPQSPVTHLRAMGGALHALEEFGVNLFIDVTGSSFQHWARVVLSLMNSISLSVRSIATDFIVSLLGNLYGSQGNVESILLIFASVLPEVAAREVALYSVSGHIFTFEDISKSLWPLRRSIADLGDANPIDDDRVDPQLAPILTLFCRSCQAILDGVLVEMRLRGDHFYVVGNEIDCSDSKYSRFDSDEESLFEAATFFLPEIAPMQRLRWLHTLKILHESKEQWVEAAETLLMCAHTILDSIHHLRYCWRPERFALWSDIGRAKWLESIGERVGHPDHGNLAVMEFASDFLEPSQFFGIPLNEAANGALHQLTISKMCKLLEVVATEGVRLYLCEPGSDELAYSRLESMLQILMSIVRDHNLKGSGRIMSRGIGRTVRTKHMEEQASFRNVVASISENMAKMVDRLFCSTNFVSLTSSSSSIQASGEQGTKHIDFKSSFVVMKISGSKPPRFLESTALPAFLEWGKPCVCRVPTSILDRVATKSSKGICEEFAAPFLDALNKECGKERVLLLTVDTIELRTDVTVLEVFPAEIVDTESNIDLALPSRLRYKHFIYKQNFSLMETTVAHYFPCALSRQRSVMTTTIETTQRMAGSLELT